MGEITLPGAILESDLLDGLAACAEAIARGDQSMAVVTEPDVDPEARTKPPGQATKPPGSHQPTAGRRNDGYIYEKSSGEAARIIACSMVIREVIQAMNDREFNEGKAFNKSIFLIPVPRFDGHKLDMEVYSFNHQDQLAPLTEICHALFSVTSFRDIDIAGIMPRDERINLIKALTEYYANLREVPSTLMASTDLQIDYRLALDALNKLEWINMVGMKKGGTIHYQLGASQAVIGPIQVKEFKLKLGSFFLEKSKGRPEGAITVQSLEPLAVAGLSKQSKAAVLGAIELKHEIPEDSQRGKAELMARKLKILRSLTTEIMSLLCPDGKGIDTILASLVIGELVSKESVSPGIYRHLFNVDVAIAEKLVEAFEKARVKIRTLALSEDLLYETVMQMLTKGGKIGQPILMKIAETIE